MDSSFIVRPIARAYTARDPVPIRAAMETGTQIALAVTPEKDSGGNSRKDQHQHQRPNQHSDPHQEQPAQDVLVDPESHAALYRERDVRCDGREHPDQALLRLRAYQAPNAAAAEPGEALPQADITT